MAAQNRTVWQVTVDTDIKDMFSKVCKLGGSKPSDIINVLMKAFVEDKLDIGDFL
jgi:antitoxin component of RelBE/YafQ-DinJ toxin-antitoxin module